MYRLIDSGFKSYLVGGAVRDLLLGKVPKDFDVSTNARPEQITNVISNSRIIGRRFKIVHAVYGHEIVEITTFRSALKSQAQQSLNGTNRFTKSTNGALVRDNNYGKSLKDDASRRDFTINALYYDISNFSIVDYFGGLYDLCHETIDIIGDPKTRYEEDPVRMIRAIRFAAKLDFKISRRTSAPILKMGVHLTYVSPDRMYEEINKLLLSGYGLKAYRLMKKYDLLKYIFGQSNIDIMTSERGNAFIEYALTCSDQRIAQGKFNVPYFLYSILLYPVFENKLFELMESSFMAPVSYEKRKGLIDKIFRQISCINIPYFVIEDISRVWMDQLDLISIKKEEQADIISRKSLFRATFDLLKLRAAVDPYLADAVIFWQPYYEERVRIHELEKAAKEKRLMEKKLKRESKKKNFDSKQKGLGRSDAISAIAENAHAKTLEKRKNRRKQKAQILNIKINEDIPF